jgi:hypothetical protein
VSAPLFDRELLRRHRVSAVAAALVVLLALVETASALIAPLRAPGDADWSAAAADVRAGWRPGDLIVAAPDWADPVLRLHLGDLLPSKLEGRLDAARFGRVWEVSQRGAAAPEVGGARATHRARHGALTVRLWERAPAAVTYDFVERSATARVSCGDGPCPAGARQGCGDFVATRPQLLEIGTTMRQALYAPPVDHATVAVEYRDVPLGRELAVGAGLHHVWMRKGGEGTVELRVLANGAEVGRTQASNRSGWRVDRFDTARFAGAPATVRFEITSAQPAARCFGFAAEARNP